MDEGKERENRAEDDELDEPKALPAREALSLISTDPLAAYGLEGLVGDTDAAASGGGEESVTSDDRSVRETRTDSASSET